MTPSSHEVCVRCLPLLLHTTTAMAESQHSKKAGKEQDGAYPGSIPQDENKISFLDLPGELQNEIYLTVLEDTGAYLTNNLRIAMPTNLSLASKQVHAQMVGQAMYAITARVRDFDFSKVVTFLNRLPEKDINLLKPKTKDSERKATLTIELAFVMNELTWSTTTRQSLMRWLKRLGVPSKRGFELEIVYVWVPRSFKDTSDMYKLLHAGGLDPKGQLTEEGEVHGRKIEDALLLSWRQEHEGVAKQVGETVCECPPELVMPRHAPNGYTYAINLRDGRCEHCQVNAVLQTYAPPS